MEADETSSRRSNATIDAALPSIGVPSVESVLSPARYSRAPQYLQ